MFRNLLTGFLTVTCLVGCVVVIHTQSPRTDSSLVNTTEPVIGDTTVTETPQIEIITPTFKSPEDPPTIVYKDKCPLFQLPDRSPLPNVPDLEQSQYKTYRDVERALVVYIASLRTHIEKERMLIETQYKTYLEQCQKK